MIKTGRQLLFYVLLARVPTARQKLHDGECSEPRRLINIRDRHCWTIFVLYRRDDVDGRNCRASLSAIAVQQTLIDHHFEGGLKHESEGLSQRR